MKKLYEPPTIQIEHLEVLGEICEGAQIVPPSQGDYLGYEQVE